MLKELLHANGRKSAALVHQQFARALCRWPLLVGAVLALIQFILAFFLS